MTNQNGCKVTTEYFKVLGGLKVPQKKEKKEKKKSGQMGHAGGFEPGSVQLISDFSSIK
jgi:hypothetical protein